MLGLPISKSVTFREGFLENMGTLCSFRSVVVGQSASVTSVILSYWSVVELLTAVAETGGKAIGLFVVKGVAC